MRDPVFVGKDVAEAVRLASRTLAVPESTLRYVVLDPGQVGGRGLSATEARIAVLIEKPGPPARPEPVRESGAEEREEGRGRGARGNRDEHSERSARPVDVAAGVRELLQRLARATERELNVEVDEGRDTLEVRIGGAGVDVLYDDTGDTIASLEHLIERSFGRDLAQRRVRVRCEGYREHRDGVLREQALDLARQVKGDGVARTTVPLNSYERRVVHVALEPEHEVVTYSVGEGHGRRVTIALATTPTDASVTQPTAVESAEPRPVAAVESAAPQMPEATREENAPTSAPATEATPQPAFDYRRFDRPPLGGATTELM